MSGQSNESDHNAECATTDQWRGQRDRADGAEGEVDRLLAGIQAVIDDRYAGDFAPLLPKLKALLSSPAEPSCEDWPECALDADRCAAVAAMGRDTCPLFPPGLGIYVGRAR